MVKLDEGDWRFSVTLLITVIFAWLLILTILYFRWNIIL